MRWIISFFFSPQEFRIFPTFLIEIHRVAYSTHCSAIRYDHYSSARKVNLEVSDSLLGLDLLLGTAMAWAHDLHHSVSFLAGEARRRGANERNQYDGVLRYMYYGDYGVIGRTDHSFFWQD